MVTQSSDPFNGSIIFSDFDTDGDETTVRVGETLTIQFKANIGTVANENRATVSTTVFLYRNGEFNDLTTTGNVTQRDKKLLIDDSASFEAREQDIVTGSLTTSQYQSNDNVDTTAVVFGAQSTTGGTRKVSFDLDATGEDRTETLYLRMVTEYGSGEVSANTGELNVTVKPREEEDRRLQLQNGEAEAVRGEQRIQSAFEEHTDFALTDLTFEDGFTPDFGDAEGSENPQLKLDERYNRPRVAIDTAARFVDHEIIGGKKVRQRVGSDPIELSVNGVCQRPRANEIDQLHRVKTAQLQSERLPQDKTRLPVQIASTTTEPLEDGGAADARTGELLYTFTINAVEVIEE
jgi:hypothetical protein